MRRQPGGQVLPAMTQKRDQYCTYGGGGSIDVNTNTVLETCAETATGAGAGSTIVGGEDFDLSEDEDYEEEECEDIDIEDSIAPAAEVAAAVSRSRDGKDLWIEFVSQQGSALIPFTLITHAPTDPDDLPDITLHDLYANSRRMNWSSPQELADLLGELLWANMTAFKIGYGWSTAHVLLAVGVSGGWGSTNFAEAAGRAAARP